jgi:hypothetical protein
MECSDPSEGTPCGFESHLGHSAKRTVYNVPDVINPEGR